MRKAERELIDALKHDKSKILAAHYKDKSYYRKWILRLFILNLISIGFNILLLTYDKKEIWTAILSIIKAIA
jgi:hypothetical protein